MLRWLAAAVGAVLTTGAAAAMAFGVNGSGGVFNGGADRVGAASSAGSLRLDVSGPLFSADGLQPGDELERCVTLENTGKHTANVALFGRREADSLAPHLHLELTRGTRPAAAAGSCAGFTPAAANFGAGGPGVLFDGSLDTFPASAETAIRPDDDIQAGEVRAYRLRVQVTGEGDDLQGLQAVQAFIFGATSNEGGSARTPTDPGNRRRPPRPNPNEPAAGLEERWCSRVDVPKPQAAAGMQRIPGTERWVVSRRVVTAYAPDGSPTKLALRMWTNRQGRSLVLALGERWSLGVAPPKKWGRVTYALNSELQGRASSRPYVWEVEPERIYPGENRVRVVVQPRSGPALRAEFRFRMKAWGDNVEESVCTLS